MKLNKLHRIWLHLNRTISWKIVNTKTGKEHIYSVKIIDMLLTAVLTAMFLAIVILT